MFVENDDAKNSGVTLQPLQRVLQLNIVLERMKDPDIRLFLSKPNPVCKICIPFFNESYPERI